MAKECINKDDLDAAYLIVQESNNCVRTPLLKNVEKLGFIAGAEDNVQIHLKLESMQTTGSFKARGVTVQMARTDNSEENSLITMSAGNYGKAFAYFCRQLKRKGTVIMPTTAPDSREVLIKKLGCEVLRVPTSELMTKVNELVTQHKMTFCHPFDDVNLISGYGSVGIEILDEVVPDVVITCCGGGGLLSGVASAVRLLGYANTRVYGVEPETANTMHRSLREKNPVSLPTAHSVASGLAPPFAGSICYEIVSEYVDDILVVSDSEIMSATKLLYDKGLVVEPSGAAAFAAIMFGKVPNMRGNVVALITGGNTTPDELSSLFKSFNL